MSDEIYDAINAQKIKLMNDYKRNGLIEKIENIKTLSELKQFEEENNQNFFWDKNMDEYVEVKKAEIRDEMWKKIKDKNKK